MRFSCILFCSLLIMGCNDELPDVVTTSYDSISKTVIDTPPSPPVKQDSVSSVKKQPRASDNEHWKKKKAEGVDFMVIGNEPFWNLEIRNKKSLRFHLAEWEQPVEISFTGSVEKTKFNELNGQDIEVRIVPQECSDGMSDYWYDYSVAVTYKGKTYKGCGIAL